MRHLTPLPDGFADTRESLRSVACYVVAPARKARVQRIGLVPVAGGFGTPPLPDGASLVVRGDQLRWHPDGDGVVLTTLRAAAAFAGLDLSPDPGVGADLPALRPDVPLGVDVDASAALGAWYELGAAVLGSVASAGSGEVMGEPQLWPEHFDLAAVAEVDGVTKVNLGFSPGDGFHANPYVYVGPHDTAGLRGAFWNAPFGAFLPYGALVDAPDSERAALEFMQEGLEAARSRRT